MFEEAFLLMYNLDCKSLRQDFHPRYLSTCVKLLLGTEVGRGVRDGQVQGFDSSSRPVFRGWDLPRSKLIANTKVKILLNLDNVLSSWL